MLNDPMQQPLVCVDIFDQVVGEASKAACHERPLLHRAFSVFLYSEKGLLLQRRALEKYHSGGLWTNACCSHPRPTETLAEAVERGLRDELGITAPCKEIASFVYYHAFGPNLYEYEYDHVFLGKCTAPLKPNPAEIMEIAWVKPDVLARKLQERPEQFTVWFLTAAPLVLKALAQQP